MKKTKTYPKVFDKHLTAPIVLKDFVFGSFGTSAINVADPILLLEGTSIFADVLSPVVIQVHVPRQWTPSLLLGPRIALLRVALPCKRKTASLSPPYNA
jgi:hypothetical protein